MPWNWNVHGEKVGRPAEAAAKATWQDYDAEYLKTMLRGRGRYAGKTRYDATDLGVTEKQVYLQEVTKGYEREAEACLKQEFKQWLQGTHEENYKAKANQLDSYYNNERGDFDGGPKRRSVHGKVFDLPDNVNGHTGWQATRWGTKPLTHLEGVRDFLRDDMAENDAAERDMNLLAHHGPQNIDEAWIYFKHWVKRRPVSTRCNPRELGQVDSDNPRMIGTGPSNWINKTPEQTAPKYPNYRVDEGGISQFDEMIGGRYGNRHSDERGGHYQAISDVPYRSRPRVPDSEIDEIDAQEIDGEINEMIDSNTANQGRIFRYKDRTRGGYSGEDVAPVFAAGLARP